MNIRLGGLLAFLLCVMSFPTGLDRAVYGQDADKNPTVPLFDGIPADLRMKVRNNPVRCDRVNDCAQGAGQRKGKTVEMRVGVQNVYANRSEDGTYVVQFDLKGTPVYLLGDEWLVLIQRQRLLFK